MVPEAVLGLLVSAYLLQIGLLKLLVHGITQMLLTLPRHMV
jgi:hypothetical protein